MTPAETVVTKGGHRSTSAGDILLDENSDYWLVDMFGFEKLSRINIEEIKF